MKKTLCVKSLLERVLRKLRKLALNKSVVPEPRKRNEPHSDLAGSSPGSDCRRAGYYSRGFLPPKWEAPPGDERGKDGVDGQREWEFWK